MHIKLKNHFYNNHSELQNDNDVILYKNSYYNFAKFRKMISREEDNICNLTASHSNNYKYFSYDAFFKSKNEVKLAVTDRTFYYGYHIHRRTDNKGRYLIYNQITPNINFDLEYIKNNIFDLNYYCNNIKKIEKYIIFDEISFAYENDNTINLIEDVFEEERKLRFIFDENKNIAYNYMHFIKIKINEKFNIGLKFIDE